MKQNCKKCGTSWNADSLLPCPTCIGKAPKGVKADYAKHSKPIPGIGEPATDFLNQIAKYDLKKFRMPHELMMDLEKIVRKAKRIAKKFLPR